MRLIKQKSKLLAILLSFAVFFMTVKPLPVSAEPGDNLDRSGVLQINMYHLDANTNQKFWLGQGSGFLISDTEDGAQYVITCNHVVSLTPEEEAAAAAYYGVERLNIKIEVVVTRDITQNCTIVKTSADDDFAILKLDEPIYQRNALALDPEGPGLTEDVYAMGYPSAVQDVQDFTYYTEDDVTVTKGSVSMKENKIGGVPYVQHSAVVTEGNSGGPLLDSTGAVIGVNTFLYDVGGGTYYYSLCIKEVTDVLDALGIKYKTATNNNTSGDDGENDNDEDEATTIDDGNSDDNEDDAVEPTTEPINSVNKNALSEALADAKGYSKDEFTEESYKALQDAISSATEVLNNSDSTQSDVDAAVFSLNNAIDDLEKSGNNTTLIIIIIIAVILVIVIVIVIIAVSSGKKKNNTNSYSGEPRPMVPPVTAPVSIPPQRIQPPTPPIPPTPPTPPTVTTTVQQPTAPVFQGEGAGETSVLGYGQGETTVLSGNNQVRASLTRVKTNEKVDITKQLFRVGKERNKVDYCVTNNNAVSRIHADIVYKNGQYFVIDNNSTNYTFVNGQMIAAKQEVALSDGDRIKFAEEEFVFNVG